MVSEVNVSRGVKQDSTEGWREVWIYFFKTLREPLAIVEINT
jgi:hypothetical protein